MQTSGLGFARSYGVGTIPVFQRDKAFQLAQGGFTLDKTGLVAHQILLSGTPLVFDEAARTAVVLRTAKLFADAANNATTYSVLKGSPLKVGDYLAAVSGGAAYAITAIDTTTFTDHDVVTVGTTLGVALTAGASLFNSTATGASAAALPAINGLLYEDTIVAVTGINQTVSAVVRAFVYARRTFYISALASVSGLDDITYSQSY
jgi:hypothetical protein